MGTLLTTIITMLTMILGILPKKIEVSASVKNFLGEFQKISDNLPGILDGSYIPADTGNILLNGIINLALEYIRKWYASNSKAVEAEIAEVIQEIQPLVDAFVNDTAAANAPPPAPPVNSTTPPEPAKTNFLTTALQHLERILGIAQAGGSPSAMSDIQAHAKTASEAITSHLAATKS